MNDPIALLRLVRLLCIGNGERLEGFKQRSSTMTIGNGERLEGFKQRSSTMTFRKSILDVEWKMDGNEYEEKQKDQSGG